VTRFLSPARLFAAGLLLLGLVFAVLWLAPAQSYYLFLPDPAHQVAPLVSVAGAKPADSRGGIYFVDVRFRKARLIERLFPGLEHGSSLVPTSAVRSRGVSEQAQRRADLHAMAVSQKIAAAVALRQLGYRVVGSPVGVRVVQVRPDVPAAPALRPDDVLLAVDGRPVRTVRDLRRAVGRHRPGEAVNLAFRRGASTRAAIVKTIADPRNRLRAIIGIDVQQELTIKLPVRVRINTRGVGGPSAGLAFALDLMEELGRDVDRGYKVAATGELDFDGDVGAIGAVKQKTIGAREAGVDVFLVPAGENAREARRYADGLRIFPVESFQQALRSLATLPRKR
jgi:Lon-like protease